jgi:hypothetical protein
MTFSAGKVTTGLVNREVILRARKMDRRDQSQDAIVCLFEGGFTGRRSSLFDLNETASLGIPLFN